jgi:hypothetical protein
MLSQDIIRICLNSYRHLLIIKVDLLHLPIISQYLIHISIKFIIFPEYFSQLENN